MIPFHLLGDAVAQVKTFIDRCAMNVPGNRDKFNELALALFAYQFQRVTPYQRLCQSRKATPDSIQHWSQIPALPTSSFKEFALTSLPPEDRPRVFFSSGTTAQTPSRHFHNAQSLALYELSLRLPFRRHFLKDFHGPAVILTPPPAATPHSSLVHMFETVQGDFSIALFTGKTESGGAWTVNTAETLATLRQSVAERSPVAVLGTAFSFVALLDAMAEQTLRLALPPGSRIFETGGYKGRSRVLTKPELHRFISRSLGVPLSFILSEYGMSELSSQAYDTIVGEPTPARIHHFPPWARAVAISPETGAEVAEGETGVLRLYDLANVASIMAVQTEDLAVRRGDGFELIGRAPQSEPRGCSLMTEL